MNSAICRLTCRHTFYGPFTAATAQPWATISCLTFDRTSRVQPSQKVIYYSFTQ